MATVKSRFSFDTNILIYAVDRDAKARHERSKFLLKEAAQFDCVLAVQALGEFYHATTRKGVLEPSRARAFIGVWRELFPLMAADEVALSDAIDAVEGHRIAFWDAMLWATARRSGCATIVSEDQQHGRKLGGVRFVNPFADDADVHLSSLFSP